MADFILLSHCSLITFFAIPAYATTIHKSQGSEFAAVVIPVHTQHYMLLQRNLLYTAITRGRRLVVLVGMPKAVTIATKRADAAKCCSALRQRLQALSGDTGGP